jgi:hypothetical protein
VVANAAPKQSPYGAQGVALVVAGKLPDGLAMDVNGTISGVPTAAGVFVFSVQAGDENGFFAQQALEIEVSGLPQ